MFEAPFVVLMPILVSYGLQSLKYHQGPRRMDVFMSGPMNRVARDCNT